MTAFSLQSGREEVWSLSTGGQTYICHNHFLYRLWVSLGGASRHWVPLGWVGGGLRLFLTACI